MAASSDLSGGEELPSRSLRKKIKVEEESLPEESDIFSFQAPSTVSKEEIKNESLDEAPLSNNCQSDIEMTSIEEATIDSADGDDKEKLFSPPPSKKKANDDANHSEPPGCPVKNCDSRGHLSGKYQHHFVHTACPLFHNTTPEECERQAKLREQHKLEKKKLQEKTPQAKFGLRKQGQTAEQREEYQNLLKSRSSFQPKENGFDPSSMENAGDARSREPDLTGFTPVYDLEMFREAQAKAAEEMENMKTHRAGLTTVNGEKNIISGDKSDSTNNSSSNNLKKMGITKIELGRFEMDVWYNSPYPEEYQCLNKLYLCEFCLKYMNSATILRRHLAKCVWRHPPGDEIYRKLNYSFFEVDGEKNKVYCQNLCLLAKLFLDHKTLYFDVEPFLFYILTEADSEGCHMIGYFSKEKNSFLNYNVSCILTIPHYQRKGFGRMLIDFSYLLTRVEQKVGSPEKPLSDLGLISYRSYWKNILLDFLSKHEGNEIVIKDLSQETGILAYDIVSTLQSLQLLKYWKGKHLIIKKQEAIDEYLAKSKKMNPDLVIDPSRLRWVPYHMR